MNSTKITYYPVPSTRCRAEDLVGTYGLTIQFILAFLAFGSLVVKRLLEPLALRRSWTVWFFDTSKQGVGASVTHMLNILLASLFRGDPCTWYFVCFMLDSTLGLFIIYIGIKAISLATMYKKQWSTLKFGEYGDPPQCRPWLHQCAAFVLLCLLEKIFVAIIMQMHIWQIFREIALSPIQNPKVEVTLVVLVFPFMLNALMFWMIDNFTMKKRQTKRYLGAATTTDVGGLSRDDSLDRLLDELDSSVIVDDLKHYPCDNRLQHRSSATDSL